MSVLDVDLNIRTVYSCFISSFSSFLFLMLCLLIGNIGLSAPWIWAGDTFNLLVSSRMVFGILLNIISTCLLTILYRSRLSVTDRILFKNYQLYTQISCLNDLKLYLASFCLAFLSSLSTIIITLSPDYSSFLNDKSYSILNWRCFVLITFGIFNGLLFSVSVITLNRLTLLFSQPKMDYLLLFNEHILSRSLSTIGRIFYFTPLCALYFKLFGNTAFSTSFTWLILDFRLIILMFISGFHLQFSWSCVVTTLKRQFTKPVDIPLTSVLLPSKSVQWIIEKSKDPIEQHLAMERIADLVTINPSIRSSIFSLSHLGGRPLLWKQISCLCLEILDQFVICTQRSNKKYLNQTSAFWPRMEIKCLKNVSPSSEMHLHRRLNLTSKPLYSFSCKEVAYHHQKSDNYIQSHDLINIVISWLSRAPIISTLKSDIGYAETAYLFNTGTDFDSQNLSHTGNSQLHLSGQVVIWATEILACLTLASFNEDPYGSVQQSLGRILVLFIDGLEAVEKHLRLSDLLGNQSNGFKFAESPQSPSKLNSGVCSVEQFKMSYYRFASDPSLPWRIYATFSWAVTNCVNQYGDHLGSITLNPKEKERLKQFRSTYCFKNDTHQS